MTAAEYLTYWLHAVLVGSKHYAASNAQFLNAAIERYDMEHGTNFGELA